MKFINKLLFFFLLLGFITACDQTELDLLDNPNAITPDKASLNDLYNNIQLEFKEIYEDVQGVPGQAARMYHAGAYTYQAFTSPNTFNGLWSNAYADLFPDVDALLALAEAGGFDIHAGSAKIMKAYALMAMVDLLGDIPLTEALQGTDIISPSAAPGEQVYAAALALLDEAIAQLDGTTAAAPAFDNFYGGRAASWVTLAKTLKLRAALNTRLIDPTGAAAKINAIVSAGDIIDESSEGFQFNFGTQRSTPDSRHPWYEIHYETGDGDYMSNYYMWLLKAEKTNEAGQTITDPRIRYYFYRKIEESAELDETAYSCHFSTLPDQSAKPAHWLSIDPNLPYCIASTDGYYGRDHLNGEGIPPDGQYRTAYGLYPAGGQFDDNTFRETEQSGTTGGFGQGIWPIMLPSFVDFMRAEAALTIGTMDDPRALLESGIRKSIAKVLSFESIVSSTMSRTVTLRDGSMGTVRELFGTDQADIDAYVNEVLALYDKAASDAERLDIVIKEYYIAAWGNGLEAYNMYRRTGLPSNMQPSLEAQPGPFPRSFFLPADHINRNANATQKTLSDRVFWDNGSVDLY